MVQDFELLEELHKDTAPRYFICYSNSDGERYYSQDYYDWNMVQEEYKTHKYLREDGRIAIYGVNLDGVHILAHERL